MKSHKNSFGTIIGPEPNGEWKKLQAFFANRKAIWGQNKIFRRWSMILIFQLHTQKYSIPLDFRKKRVPPSNSSQKIRYFLKKKRFFSTVFDWFSGQKRSKIKIFSIFMNLDLSTCWWLKLNLDCKNEKSGKKTFLETMSAVFPQNMSLIRLKINIFYVVAGETVNYYK